MGYALNLCKFHIYNVPYNHNIAEEGMEMTQNRVRIVDVADALGLSTATVSKVIHGKTEKISDKTVKRVQLRSNFFASSAIRFIDVISPSLIYPAVFE